MSWLQRHWDARAAANFMLGGSGSGLLVCSALMDEPGSLVLGLALIGAGLLAVWLEIGRKLRAAHVFLNPFTSWMSRESLAAVLVFVLGFSFLLFRQQALLYGAALAAAAFLWCQARMLHAAKGIPAWRAPQTVPLIVATGLAEGAGLALLFSTETAVLAAFALAVAARFLAWRRYRTAVGSEALEAPGKALVWIGSVAALAFVLLTPLAGLAALFAGWWLKLALITRASINQGYSLPHLPVRGAR